MSSLLLHTKPAAKDQRGNDRTGSEKLLNSLQTLAVFSSARGEEAQEGRRERKSSNYLQQWTQQSSLTQI